MVAAARLRAPAELELIVRAARARSMTPSTWMRRVLLAAARRVR